MAFYFRYYHEQYWSTPTFHVLWFKNPLWGYLWVWHSAPTLPHESVTSRGKKMPPPVTGSSCRWCYVTYTHQEIVTCPALSRQSGLWNKELLWQRECKELFSFSSVTQCPTLWPYESQHARPPCPSPTPRVYSDSCPLSRWCHPTISSSVIPFSSRLLSFPASGSLQMSQLFAPGGQSIGVSASALVLPMNVQDQFPLGWSGWISLQSKGLSRVFSNTTVQKHQIFSAQLSL